MNNEPVIREIILKRFRSIPTGAVEFDNPTFLVGRNGSGKSNFSDSVAFLAEAMSSPLQAVFDKRGGISIVRNRTSGRSYPPNLGLGVVFGRLNGEVRSGRYAFEIRAVRPHGFEVVREQCFVETSRNGRFWFDRGKKFISNVPGLNPTVDPELLGFPAVAGVAQLAPVLKTLASMRVYRLDPAKLGSMQEPDTGVNLQSDGSNAASVLQEIERHSREDLGRIGEILETIVPKTTKVRAIKHGNKLSLEFSQQWGGKKKLTFESFSMSDGTLRALGLLLAVYQKPSPSLIVIEEPEATIHPGAMGAILDLLRQASRRMQVVVTTHSPEVLEAKWIQGNHIRVVTWEDGATQIGSVSDSSSRAIRDHLMGAGELMRSNALHPASLFATDLAQPELFEEIG